MYNFSLKSILRVYNVYSDKCLIAKIQVTDSEVTAIFVDNYTEKLKKRIYSWAPKRGLSIKHPMIHELKKKFGADVHI